MKPLSLYILQLFGELGEDRLDRHVLIEAAGKEPAERRDVLDAVDGLIRAGMLDAGGRDYCAFTERG